jgi:4-amino-4-deoxy-L-arabinose transferase-like glycosyltransferase
MLACWAGMALAVLSKGLIGIVLPGGVLVLYTADGARLGIWKRLHLAKGLLLFFLIAAPWFVLVGLKNPEQPHFFFIHEHFDRFLSKDHNREGRLVVLPAAAGRRQPALAGRAGAKPGAGRAQDAGHRAGTLPSAPAAAGLGAVHHAVLHQVAFQAARLHRAGVPGLALLVGYYLDVGPRRCRMLAAGLTALLGVGFLVLVPFMERFARPPRRRPDLRGLPALGAGGRPGAADRRPAGAAVRAPDGARPVRAGAGPSPVSPPPS